MRIVRSSMLEVLDSEYIKMIRAKGLPRRLVIWKHALKNASIPIFTLFMVNFAQLISGAVVTETIFGWPGIGRLLVDSIFVRDFAVAQTVVFFGAGFIVAINLTVDIIYGFLDPEDTSRAIEVTAKWRVVGRTTPRNRAAVRVVRPRRRTACSRCLLAACRELFAHAMRGVPKFSFFYLSVIIIVTIFAPLDSARSTRSRPSPRQISCCRTFSWGQNLLGTDHLGRDILSRMIYGARISVVVGFMAVFISGALGTMIALVSGVARGWVDTILMRLTDAFLALPYLMVAVTVIAIFGAGLWNVILVIALLRWMTYARITRGEVLTLMQMDYIRLARVAGASNTRIILRHLAPNVFNTLLVLGTLEVGLAIIAEASLSFLGLGIPRPQPSWGTMLAESQEWVFVAWWLPMVPGVAITLLVMSFNLMGDWLRDRTDPTRRQL